MPNGNPFYVQPLGGLNLGQTIQGVSSVLKEKREADRRQALAGEASRLLTEGTPEEVRKFALKNPEIGERLQAQIDRAAKDTEYDLLNTTRAIMANPENAIPILTKRMEKITDRGGDPSDTAREIQAFREDPEGALRSTELAYAMLDPVGSGAVRAVGAEERAEARDIRKEERAAKREEEKAKLSAEILAAETARDKKTAQQKQVNVLRDDIKDITKDFRNVEAAYSRIKAVGDKATAASDLSLIFNFMKINDPGSVVRETEFKNAEQARAWMSKMDNEGRAVPAFVVQGIQKLTEGTRLLPEQRKDFIERAGDLFEGQRSATDNQIENILQQADQDEIGRARVLGSARLSDYEKRRQRRQTEQLPEGVTEEDIAVTMEANNMTREQVLSRLMEQQ